MKTVNEMKLCVPSKSCNEAFARCVVSAFVMSLDPTVNELSDLKTAVSEAVTNCIVHAYPEGIGPVTLTAALYEGGVVRITVTEEGSELVIRVIDTGCGIPAQYRESIFQPFFRVEQSRSRAYGGVGLGLALVWEIAALHGGRVAVEQSDETGTTMAVRLPAGRE